MEDDHHCSEDGFDLLPDALILVIFNQLSDIKTLTRCRAVSKRFNSLVPQSENLFVKVDCVISSEPEESFLVNILKSVLQSLQDLISPKRLSLTPRNRSSPAEILRGFERIKRLELELPAGDLKVEKGTVLKWKAEFGKSLKSCVILAIREEGDGAGDEIDFNGGDGGGLKLRVVWTISALIAASSRHFLLREVVKEHGEIENLVLRDREEEGMVVMRKDGLKELREVEGGDAQVSTVGWKNRTTVPAVRMRMRHVSKLEIGGGVSLKSATLVVIRPAETVVKMMTEKEEEVEDKEIAMGAFGDLFEETVLALLKRPSYLLEMNSF